jgi:hypothetical protein
MSEETCDRQFITSAPKVVSSSAMRTTLAALLLAACTATEPPAPRPASAPRAPAPVTTRPLSLPGVTVDVPERWVALEPERTEAIRASAVRESAEGSLIAIAAARDPAGMMPGTAYVQRSEIPRDPIDVPETVHQSLERLRDDLRERLAGAGMAIEHFSFADKDGGLEGCVHARIDSAGQSAALWACLRFVALAAERMLYVNVNCMAPPADAEAVCGPILASRRLDTVAGLGFDEQLPPNAVPLPGVGRDRVAGLIFGDSRAAFVAACKRAKLRVDEFDWQREPPLVKQLVQAGRMAQCSGLPPGDGPELDVGRVLQVNATFSADRLAAVTLYVDGDPAQLEARLGGSYPRGAEEAGRRVHLIRDDAALDEVLSVGIGPPYIAGARFSLTFVSPRNLADPLVAPGTTP